MFKRKTQEREEWTEVLAPQGITYVPMVASHFGSLHPTFNEWVTLIATNLSRRQGKSRAAVNRQIRGRLGAALARRAARMSLATWMGSSAEADVPFQGEDYEDIDREPAVGGDDAGIDEEFRAVRPFRDTLGRRVIHTARPERVSAQWDPGPIAIGWGSAHLWQVSTSPVADPTGEAYVAAAPACPVTDGMVWQ